MHLTNRKTTNAWSVPFTLIWHMACPASAQLNITTITNDSRTSLPTAHGQLGLTLWQSSNFVTCPIANSGLTRAAFYLPLSFQNVFATRWKTHSTSRAHPRPMHKAKKSEAHNVDWWHVVLCAGWFQDKGTGMSPASAFLTCHGNVTDVLEPVKCPLPSEVGPFFPLLTGGENI